MQSYSGFVTIGDEDFGLRVCKQGGKKKLLVELSESLAVLFEGLESVVDRKVEQNGQNVDDLVTELIELGERVRNGQAGTAKRLRRAPMREAGFYTLLVAEIEDKSLDIVGVSEELDEIKLRCTDLAGRAHTCRVLLPDDYPQSPPTCFAELPSAVELIDWDPATSGLKTVAEQFKTAVNQYQRFWDVLDEIDAKTWVLQDGGGPATRAAVSRRIVIATHCYIQITLDPLSPTHLPRISFLGADNRITPLKEALNLSANLWNLSASLLSNLQTCLKVSFPQPTAQEKDIELNASACGICYEFHHDDQNAVPDIICTNDRCKRSFHRQCLYEWLRSIPTTKQSFSTLFGECPFCSSGISFSVVKK